MGTSFETSSTSYSDYLLVINMVEAGTKNPLPWITRPLCKDWEDHID